MTPSPNRGRAVSTVLDAALFLLLVSAAVGLLLAASGGDDGSRDTAAETATTVATTTTAVEYEPATVTESWNDGERRDHGTAAELLASAAVASSTVDGQPFAPAPAYESTVRETVERTVADAGGDASIQVRAVWEPVPGAEPAGEVVVGPSPPREADVHAATFEVPLADGYGTSATDTAANPTDTTTNPTGSATSDDRSAPGPDGGNLTRIAQREGYDGLASALARAIVDVAHPPRPSAATLDPSNPDRSATVERYEATAMAVGVDPGRVPVEGNATHTNRALSDALADRLEPHLRERYESPTAAAEAASPTTVTVVVRTWSG